MPRRVTHAGGRCVAARLAHRRPRSKPVMTAAARRSATVMRDAVRPTSEKARQPVRKARAETRLGR